MTGRGDDADALMLAHSDRVVTTWLLEFGYVYGGLRAALGDRSFRRLNTELSIHATRLAKRATMRGGTRITGRAGVIR